jgi:hypothetical protein
MKQLPPRSVAESVHPVAVTRAAASQKKSATNPRLNRRLR